MSITIWPKRIGRLRFLLSSVVIVGLCGGAGLLLRSHGENRHVLFVVQYSLILLGVAWIRLLEGRLEDAGLPHWAFWPYFLAVFTVCFGAHAHRITGGPQTLALFLVLQIPAFLLQSQPEPGTAGEQASRVIPKYLRPVGPFLFLLRVVLIAAFAIAFFHLALAQGPGVARWEMAVALLILGFAWIYNVEGRVLDAGLPSWVSAAYCLAAPGLCLLPFFLELAGLRVALALFILLQIPTVFLPSKAIPAAPGSPASQRPRHTEPLGALDFAVYILLIAGLWHVLHLLRGDVSGHWTRALDLALDAGSLALFLAWVFSMKRRLKAFGLTCWHIDICSVVLMLCVCLFAFRILSFPLALILFVVLQAPLVFLRREFIPARFLPADSDS